MIKIETVRTVEDFHKLKSVWNTLADGFFQSFEWNSIWLEHFSKGKKLNILLAKKDSEIKAIAPLKIEGRTIRFIGYPYNDYGGFLGDTSVFAQFFRHLEEQAAGGLDIELDEIPESSPIVGQKMLRSHVYFTNPTLFLEMNDPDLRRRLTTRSMRRKANQLKRLGARFMRIRQVDEAQEIMEVHFRLHVERWRELGQQSMFEAQETRAFFRSLIDNLLAKDMMGVWAIMHEGKPIAVNCGFYHDRTFCSYCQSHDTQYNKYGIGIAAMKQLIEYNLEKDIDIFDMSRGAEGYKYKFINRTGTNLGIGIYNSRIRNQCMRCYHALREHIIKSPRLHKRLTKCRAKLRTRLCGE